MLSVSTFVSYVGVLNVACFHSPPSIEPSPFFVKKKLLSRVLKCVSFSFFISDAFNVLDG